MFTAVLSLTLQGDPVPSFPQQGASLLPSPSAHGPCALSCPLPRERGQGHGGRGQAGSSPRHPSRGGLGGSSSGRGEVAGAGALGLPGPPGAEPHSPEVLLLPRPLLAGRVRPRTHSRDARLWRTVAAPLPIQVHDLSLTPVHHLWPCWAS